MTVPTILGHFGTFLSQLVPYFFHIYYGSDISLLLLKMGKPKKFWIQGDCTNNSRAFWDIFVPACPLISFIFITVVIFSSYCYVWNDTFISQKKWDNQSSFGYRETVPTILGHFGTFYVPACPLFSFMFIIARG